MTNVEKGWEFTVHFYGLPPVGDERAFDLLTQAIQFSLDLESRVWPDWDTSARLVDLAGDDG